MNESLPAVGGAAATPMIAQYLEVKAKHPDFLLFYRMGDFFELFFDDAVRAAAALGIQLTKRGKHEGRDIPMCGVPAVRADEYLQKLIRKGYRVAIAEQLEDPDLAKKRGPKAIVRRDVVRLVTPGTLTEDALLSSARNNFLTAAVKMGKPGAIRHSLASLDLSTGEFLCGEVLPEDLEGELMKLRPSEILVPEGDVEDERLAAALKSAGGAVSPLPRASFAKAKGERALKEAFEVAALDGLGDFREGELAAIGALLHYVNLTQMGERPALRPPRREDGGAHLVIDAATRASLELARPNADGAPTVFSAIDRTVTGAGARELMTRLVAPSADAEVISDRLDAVSALVDDRRLREAVRQTLKRTPDMSRALSRLTLRRGCPRDLGVLRDGLAACGELKTLLANAPQPRLLAAIAAALGRIPQGLARELEHALADPLPAFARDGGFVAAGYDAELDEARGLAGEAKTVLARLQANYCALTGVRSLKIQHNQVFGYFIEVAAGAAPALQADRHGGLFRLRQTLANAVRFTTDELSALESRIVTASSDALNRELAIFERLADAVVAQRLAIGEAAAALAELDCTAGLAELAQTEGYVRPRIDTGRCFLVEGGRHPSVEQALTRDRAAFIANDCRLDGSGSLAPALLVVTGPNMAGKSTYLRQNALMAVLAQMGSFVPAKSAHIGIADRLFARVGAADDLSRGRSTFMVEMTETAAILNRATDRSLVILDEIGRGTATFDGLSIAWAVIEHLHDAIGCRGLAATHYHELTRLADSLPRAANVRMAVTEWKDTIVFLHSVEEGAAKRSYGVHAARLAGVPRPVVARAKQVLAQLEAGSGPHGPLVLPTDMPLFSVQDATAENPDHPILAKLAAADLDNLSPRDALDFLYALKAEL